MAQKDRVHMFTPTYASRFPLMLFTYSIIHFAVDFACVFLLFSDMASAPDWYIYVLLYNFFAFAVQLPLGIVADNVNKNYLFAAAGCVFIA